jgi:DHA2 family multidrug resistance protein
MGLYGVMFAVPIFVQNYLEFTATQSGVLLMPGAIASAVMMIIMGKVAGKVDARLLIASGALVLVTSAIMLSRINPDTGTDSLFWPLVLRGLGTVAMFLPLSLATIGDLPKRDIAAGSGFYNLTRQMGSSIGIALITTALAHREAVHRAVLTEKFADGLPQSITRVHAYTGAFLRHTADPVHAHQQALSAVDRLLDGQALLLSFADVFYYVAFAFIITLPLLFFLGKGANKAAAAAAH